MTCLLALKHGNPDDDVLVSEIALSGADPDARSAELQPRGNL